MMQEELPNALALRGGEWLPADSDPETARYVKELASDRMGEEATRTMELARLAGMTVTCPQCGGKILYQLRAAIDKQSGDEYQSTEPCPICEYSEVVTIIPKRALELRRRIEALKGHVTEANVKRYNSLLRQYRRAMARVEQRGNDGDGSIGNRSQ